MNIFHKIIISHNVRIEFFLSKKGKICVNKFNLYFKIIKTILILSTSLNKEIDKIEKRISLSNLNFLHLFFMGFEFILYSMIYLLPKD